MAATYRLLCLALVVALGLAAWGLVVAYSGALAFPSV